MVVRIEHESPQVTIEVLPELRLLRSTWRGDLSGEAYREALMRILDLVERDRLKYWLTDGREMGPILFKEQQWSTGTFMPMLAGVGLERIAIVSSSDVLNAMAVDRMVSATPGNATYTIAYFENPSIAQLWLMKKDEQGLPVEPRP
ncbi:MAG: hypothetical protein JST66_16680 [Bacteroidetes bacterium]|nr:hypothetical protein [Bacteroidota bacterium]